MATLTPVKSIDSLPQNLVGTVLQHCQLPKDTSLKVAEYLIKYEFEPFFLPQEKTEIINSFLLVSFSRLDGQISGNSDEPITVGDVQKRVAKLVSDTFAKTLQWVLKKTYPDIYSENKEEALSNYCLTHVSIKMDLTLENTAPIHRKFNIKCLGQLGQSFLAGDTVQVSERS